MIESWRSLVVAAVLTLSAGMGVATAQTVLVRNAPPGSAIELVLNSATIGTGTADGAGNASIAAKLPATTDTDVHIYVDLCAKSRQILFIERGLQPRDAAQGCDRREITGWFMLRPVTSILVDAGATPSVWLRQGPIPTAWLTLAPGEQLPRRTVPKGLVLFGAGGLEKYDNAETVACGDTARLTDCTSKTFRPSYMVGAELWVTRYVAAEVTYLKPGNATATGSGATFRFDNTLDVQVFTIAAKVAAPTGAVRVYGRFGLDYHRATSTTHETINDTTITVDGVTQTIPGGTQTAELQTRGWSWMFGGGVEGWVTPHVAIFGEAGLINLRGAAVGGGEGAMEDRLTSLLVGLKVHVGK